MAGQAEETMEVLDRREAYTLIRRGDKQFEVRKYGSGRISIFQIDGINKGTAKITKAQRRHIGQIKNHLDVSLELGKDLIFYNGTPISEYDENNRQVLERESREIDRRNAKLDATLDALSDSALGIPVKWKTGKILDWTETAHFRSQMKEEGITI